MSPSKTALAAIALGAAALLHAACDAGDGACLRRSDCEAPFQCVEGTCRSDETLGDQVRDAATDP